ncbi:hypothetical protein [Carboxylicivirga sp. RSCT41]|uniref:hypothetical protein n=1 Tax=Carboxylicivirga agarovorans TaxID=3417570 RepID=UPI003D33B98E
MKHMRLLILALLILISATSIAQTNTKVELTEYIREIQIWHKEQNNMSLAFWIPKSYWRLALADSPMVNEQVLSEIERAFEDYVLVCALDGEIQVNGMMTFTNKTELSKTIAVIDSDNNNYFPLTNEELSPEALAFSEAIRPMFAQMLGQMGQGMHFYFFEVKDQQGANVFNEYQKGQFKIKHSNKEFEYKLPLVCLLPSKKCPVDGAEMKGNWEYCPYHGVELKE